MTTEKTMDFRGMYPTDFDIVSIERSNNTITIKLASHTTTCTCPKCGVISGHRHGTYVRRVQDLPILGHATLLLVNAREYQCDNPECDVTTFVETANGFISYYSRMTERCADFICTLAMETSCEGCARICNAMNLKISGDSVIRLLTRRFQLREEVKCGSVIGVDDFAFKKRHTYGTIIVDGATHKPVAILDGRDGQSLKEWLRQNKQVKAVTRDRASAYASAIQEVLPDAMQIADRFHLHQNLLDAIKNSVNSLVPTTIKIHKECEAVSRQADSKEPEGPSGKKNPIHCG